MVNGSSQGDLISLVIFCHKNGRRVVRGPAIVFCPHSYCRTSEAPDNSREEDFRFQPEIDVIESDSGMTATECAIASSTTLAIGVQNSGNGSKSLGTERS